MTRVIVVLMWLVAAIPCAGEIITVDDDGPADFSNIQPAIDDANDGDTIVVYPGRYGVHVSSGFDFHGKAVSVRSVDPADEDVVSATVIDCNSNGPRFQRRGFWFHSGEDANSVVEGLTITNGYASDGGGAIRCEQMSSPTIANCRITDCFGYGRMGGGGGICLLSNATVRNCLIKGNTAGNGGGLVCGPGSGATIEGCTITGNTADYGGGLQIVGPASVINCIISKNTGGQGGGVLCDSDGGATIEGCTITENAAGSGGGLSTFKSVWVSNCVFRKNTAEAAGGGLYVPGYGRETTIALAVNCIFEGNRAERGGGAHLTGNSSTSAIDLQSCVFAGNRAQEGGALYLMGPYGRTTNCTFSGNAADSRGGGISFTGGSLEQILTNCILWGNTAGTGSVEDAQTHPYPSLLFNPPVEFNCIQDDDPDDANIPYGHALPGAPANNGNIDDDPLFVRMPDDGGDGWGDDPQTAEVDEGANDDYGDLHLRQDSPCIDAGSPSQYGLGEGVDIDGEARSAGFRVDMGADEYGPIIAVTRPEGGEVWVAGTKHEIAWLSWAHSGPVDIMLSRYGGEDYEPLAAGVPDSGGIVVELPQAADSNQCVIAVVPSGPNPDVLIIESETFTIHPDTVGPTVAAGWKTLGGDFGRSGLSDFEGPDFGCLKWKFETGGPVVSSVTIGAEERVHIACEDGRLYTVDANGVLLWSYDANSPLLSSPTVGPDGSVYAGGENGWLYAVDVNGNCRWTCSVEGRVYSSPAVSEQGSIFVGSDEGRLYAIGQDGLKLWDFQIRGTGRLPSGSIFASPAIGSDGTVYVGGLYDPNLYALDPCDGSVKWMCSFQFPVYVDANGDEPGGLILIDCAEGYPLASPVVGPDGTIYQTLIHDSNLYAINPDDGTIRWSTDLDLRCDFVDEHIAEYGQMPPSELIEVYCPGWRGAGPYAFDRYERSDGWSEPAIGPDGTIYVSFDDPFLRAVEPNGAIKWVTRLGVVGGFTLTVGSDGLIYAAGDDGGLCVVDPNGGEIARSAGDAWPGYPVVAAGSTIIVGDGRDYSVMIPDANNAVRAYSAEGCEERPFLLHEPGDVDGSGAVDFGDFALLAAAWRDCSDSVYKQAGSEYYPACDYEGEAAYLPGDTNRDLYVFLQDLAALADRWLAEQSSVAGPERPLGPRRPPPGWLQ